MKLLLGSHYFVYFGTLGVFLPYFNLFCRHLGFSGFEIGLISSVKTATVVIFPVLWAMAADRFNARKPILLFCTFMSCLLWIPLLFSREFDFLSILFIIAFQSVFYAPIISFLEAFAMDILGREKKKYGRSRMWGSIAFIGASMGLGKLLSFHPTDVIIPMILAGMFLQMLLCLKMPSGTSGTSSGSSDALSGKPDKPPGTSRTPSGSSDALSGKSGKPSGISSGRTIDRSAGAGSGHLKLSGFKNFFSTGTTLFLLAAFLMLVSHGAYYGFFSIYLESLGFTTGFIGFAWALASIAEITVMAGSGAIFARFDLKTVLLISFAAAVFRWLLLFSTTSAMVILFSQLLHALTYGAFHIASILAIDRLSTEGGSTFGQAVNNAVTYGAGMMTGFILSGVFYDLFQGYLFLASSGCALVGGIIMACVNFSKMAISPMSDY